MPFACRVRLCRRRMRASRQVCCSLPPPACPLLPRLPPGMWMDSPGPADVFPFRGRRADSPEHPIVFLSRNRRVGVLGDFLSGVSPPPLFRQAYPLPYARRRTLTHCGKMFTPTSNRQLFCSRECWNQARLEQKKADREAERGTHYYRQRTCAVCGHSYWPTHSQQEFCSEECRRINHNSVVY